MHESSTLPPLGVDPNPGCLVPGAMMAQLGWTGNPASVCPANQAWVLPAVLSDTPPQKTCELHFHSPP